MSLVWYFAYGSNMSEAQMKERRVTYVERVAAELPGYRFAFNKRASNGACSYANIERVTADDGGGSDSAHTNSAVYGWLYSCPPEALVTLDGWEGTPAHYRREAVRVHCLREDGSVEPGEPVDAVTYVAQPDWIVGTPPLAPRADYADKVVHNLGAPIPELYRAAIEAFARQTRQEH